MNILYIAPRFHTNQVPIIKGWLEQGDYVKFISQYEGKIENHSILEPDVLGYSKVFLIINSLYELLKRKELNKSANRVAFKVKCGFPSIYKLSKKIVEFNPDLVILRERSLYTIFAYSICRTKKIKTILYNQTPLWEDKVQNKYKSLVMKLLTPQIRITPVLGEKKNNSQKDQDAYFVPFVIEKQIEGESREYFKYDKVNLLCVGKYEKRKNQLMLLENFKELCQKYEMTLTLVGEVSTEHHKEYAEIIKAYIVTNKLEDKVKMLSNLSPIEVMELYKISDVFVLPSTKEMASISQLEAMACGDAIICSKTNGTACYVEDNKNGYLFEDEDSKDLKCKIENMLADRTKIMEMGAKSLWIIQEKYSFFQYNKAIKKIMKKG